MQDLKKNLTIKKAKKKFINKYKFTNCNECLNKFTETCITCSHYYGCKFEKKLNKKELK